MPNPQAISFTKKRCWAEIDLEALRQNVVALRKKTLGENAGIIAIVKANGYGHGVIPIVRELVPLVQGFGVANLAEASQLPQSVPPTKIFILGTALPDERPDIARAGFVPVISSLDEAAAYGRLAQERPLPVNVVIDTGMGRIGIRSEDAIGEVRAIAALPGIEIRTVSTHLPVADEDETFTADQLVRFENIVTQLREAGIRAPLIHSLNSAGAIRFAGHARDFSRVGLALYGSSPIPQFQRELRAVMTLKTRVTIVRDVPAGQGISYGRTYITPAPMRIATLAIGYADGYQRRLSGQGAHVLIRGTRCPILGRVTMDQIMVDVTHLPDVVPGDEAVVLGRQGGEEIFAADLAAMAGTIAWEIFTGISCRVERIYLHTGETSAS